jgi:trk system potassium uptake protein TrkA
MRAVIIGGGEIGKAISEALVKEDNDVTIIDVDESVGDEISTTMDVQVLHGSGCNPSVLKKARVQEAGLVAVVTDRDEDNLCASMLVRHLAPKAILIARIRNPDIASEEEFLMREGPRLTHILKPEVLAAKKIYDAIRIPFAVDVTDFENGKVFLIGVKIPRTSPLAGIVMKDIPRILHSNSVLFVARYREGALLVPRGNSDIQPEDLLYFISKAQDIPSIAEAIGLGHHVVRTAVVAGATETGLHLARLMLKGGMGVKLIEKNHALAAAALEALPGALVLEADPIDPTLWDEENIDKADALVSVCREEEVNLMVALMGRKRGVKHTAVITYRSSFISLLLESGITTVISPRSTAIGSVVQFLRKGRILQISETEHEDAELIEYEVREGDRISGKALRDIEFPKGAVVGAIFSNNDVLIPSGATRIDGGDKVLIFARKKVLPGLERLMSDLTPR